MPTRLDPDSRPQPRVHVVVGQHLEEVHRRAVHDHLVTGVADPDTEGLGVDVHGAGHHRGAGGNAGRRRRLLRDLADDLARPGQPREADRLADLHGPVVVPAEAGHPVERVALARGVVVHHVLTGQLGGDERVGAVPAVGPPPDLRLVLADPLELGTQGLEVKNLPPLAKISAAPYRWLRVDLLGRPRVDAVEDGGSQWPQIVVAQHQAGSHTADADPDHRAAGAVVSSRQMACTSRHQTRRRRPRPNPAAATRSDGLAGRRRRPHRPG